MEDNILTPWYACHTEERAIGTACRILNEVTLGTKAIDVSSEDWNTFLLWATMQHLIDAEKYMDLVVRGEGES